MLECKAQWKLLELVVQHKMNQEFWVVHSRLQLFPFYELTNWRLILHFHISNAALTLTEGGEGWGGGGYPFL